MYFLVEPKSSITWAFLLFPSSFLLHPRLCYPTFYSSLPFSDLDFQMNELGILQNWNLILKLPFNMSIYNSYWSKMTLNYWMIMERCPNRTEWWAIRFPAVKMSLHLTKTNWVVKHLLCSKKKERYIAHTWHQNQPKIPDFHMANT